MIEDDPQPSVQVKERERLPFPRLEFETVVAPVDLPIVVATPVAVSAPVEVIVPVAVAPPVEVLPEVNDDTFVPDDVTQRLIQFWLIHGPKDWSASIVAADTVVPDDTLVFDPRFFRRPRVVGPDFDGTRRMIVPRL
jgi:hypothetical protein